MNRRQLLLALSAVSAVAHAAQGVPAKGRMPVIFIGDDDGEVARTLRRARCGVTVQRGDQLAAAILELRGDPDARARMAAYARAFFDAELKRATQIARYRRLIEELAR